MNGLLNYNSLDEIKKLSVATSILLVEDIWDSIYSSEADLPMTDEQKKELESRLEEYRQNPEARKPWEDARDNIKSRLSNIKL